MGKIISVADFFMIITTFSPDDRKNNDGGDKDNGGHKNMFQSRLKKRTEIINF